MFENLSIHQLQAEYGLTVGDEVVVHTDGALFLRRLQNVPEHVFIYPGSRLTYRGIEGERQSRLSLQIGEKQSHLGVDMHRKLFFTTIIRSGNFV